jgi:hypothetical protein
VERPSGTLHNIKSQPQRVQQLYKVADYMLTIGETVEKATEQVRVDGIAQEHIEYARYVTTEAERRLRELRERINS